MADLQEKQDVVCPKDTARIFKALCDENRVRILLLLRSGEKCACKLLEELPVSQPTLSHHMKILCDSGLVMGRKEGKWTHYSISPEGREQAMACLQAVTALSDISGEINGGSCCCQKS